MSIFLGARCVSSWISCGLKHGIPWHLLLFLFVYINFMSSCSCKALIFYCLGTRCVRSWSSYVLKQGFHGFFLSPFVHIMLCLPVNEKHKHFLVWEHVVSAHVAATSLNRESLDIFFVSLCLFYFMSSCS